MAFPPVRRQRRRRTILVLLVLLLAAMGTAYAITRAQSDRQLQREYLDLAADIASGEEDAAVQFSDMIIRLDEMSRPVVMDGLAEIEETVVGLSRRLESADPPPGRLERAHVFFAVAAQKWKDGVIGTRAGMETLSESPLDPEGLATLDIGLVDLRVGDASYAEFLQLVTEIEAGEAEPGFPPVTYVPEESALLFDAGDIARRMFLTPDLGVVRNLGVADIKLEPGPVGDRDGIPVVPISDSLDAEVTISNRGTVEESGVLVQLDLISSDGSRVTFEQEIELIAPDALTGLAFEDLPVEPGGLYEIVASLPGDDDDESDDRMSMVFIRNDES